jgi:valyl-tRNA synthetase
MQVTNHSYQPSQSSEDILSDWMGSKIHQTAENCQTHIKQYRFDLASAEIYELVWSNFCDWYIEFSKVAIQKSDDANQTNNLIGSLITNFYSILELLHPFMPFITEELSSKLADLAKVEKLGFMVEDGFAHAPASNEKTEQQLDEIISIISALRVIRAENQNIKNETFNLIISNDLSSEMQSVISKNESVIAGIAKLDGIEFSDKIPVESIEKTMDGYKLIIPLEGLIDPEEEMMRLQKELADVENDIKIISSKLANEQFISKAPTAVVEKEKAKVSDAESKKAMLEKSIAKLQP